MNRRQDRRTDPPGHKVISADSMSWSYTVRRDPRPAPTASDTRCYGESGSSPPCRLLGSRGGSEALHCAPHRGEELGLEVPPVVQLRSSRNRVGSLDRSQVSDTPPYATLLSRLSAARGGRVHRVVASLGRRVPTVHHGIPERQAWFNPAQASLPLLPQPWSRCHVRARSDTLVHRSDQLAEGRAHRHR